MCRGERAFFSVVFRGPYHLLCLWPSFHQDILEHIPCIFSFDLGQHSLEHLLLFNQKPCLNIATSLWQDILVLRGGYSSFFSGGLASYKLGCPSCFNKLGCPSCFNKPTTPLKKNLNKSCVGGARFFLVCVEGPLPSSR